MVCQGFATPLPSGHSQTVQHRFDRGYLIATFLVIVGIIVPPPIPAGIQVQDIAESPPVPSETHNGLWIQDDDVIRVSHLVIPRILVKLITNGVVVLKTTMEGHVYSASD